MNWKGRGRKQSYTQYYHGRKQSYTQYYQRDLPQMTKKFPSLEGTTFMTVYIKQDSEDCKLLVAQLLAGHPSGTGLSRARQRMPYNKGFANLPRVHALNIKPGLPGWGVGHDADNLILETL
jgi:hypothetical protein